MSGMLQGANKAAPSLAAEGSRPGTPGQEERCAVCLGVLCEPVAWPSCSHAYCLVCSVRTRERPKPSCPLCRAPATRIRRASELQVDSSRAAQVRRALGYSKYEAQRREIWVEAAALDAQGSLGELPLFSMGPWHFRAGARHRLRILEPRYREMLRRVTAPGGRGCFAAVLQPAEFEVGAKGRVCEILESGEDPNGETYVVVEGGAACQILEVAREEVQGGEALFHGSLDEVDEEEMESFSDAFVPLAAASEMVDLLSTLGRQLRTMRRRRQLLAMLGRGEVEPEGAAAAGESVAAAAAAAAAAGGDGEGVGAMLSLLVSYRSIIAQMDRLLSEASQTAERLGLGGAPDLPAVERPAAERPAAEVREAAASPAPRRTRRASDAASGAGESAARRRHMAPEERASTPALASPTRTFLGTRAVLEESGVRSSSPAAVSSPGSRSSQRASRMSSAGNAALLLSSNAVQEDLTMTQGEALRRRGLFTRGRSMVSPLDDTTTSESVLAETHLGRRSPGGAAAAAAPRRRSGTLPRSPQTQPATPERSRRTGGGMRQGSILLRAATTTMPTTRPRGHAGA